MRIRRTDPELLLVSLHIQQMLVGLETVARTHTQLRQPEVTSRVSIPLAAHNALIIAFMIHFRSLFDFFYSTSPQPGSKGSPQIRQDDAIADDFFHNDLQWRTLVQPPPAEFYESKRDAGKHLAHLTYTRVNEPYFVREWDFASHINLIYGVTEFFLEHAPAHLIDDSLRCFDFRYATATRPAKRPPRGS